MILRSKKLINSLVILIFSMFIFPVLLLFSYKKLLWTDELLTVIISQQPTFKSLWRLLVSGEEGSAPFNFYLTKFLCILFGPGHITYRLSAIIGYWIASICIFLFVKKRLPTAYAVLAIVFLLTTLAFYYGYEARPYGIFLGMSAASLFFWQLASEKKKLLPLFGLSVSLALAILNHLYAVLIFIPLIIAESFHSWRIKKLNWPIVFSFLAGLTPIFFLFQVIKNAFFLCSFGSRGNFIQLSTGTIACYNALLGDSVLLFSTLIIILIFCTKEQIHPPEKLVNNADRGFKEWELIAILGIALLPVLNLVLAIVKTKLVIVRHLIPTTIGIAIIFAVLIHSLAKFRKFSNTLLYGVMIVFALGHVCLMKSDLAERSMVKEKKGLFSLLKAEDLFQKTKQPIVFADMHTYFYLKYYSPENLAKRFVLLSDWNIYANYIDFSKFTDSQTHSSRDFLNNTDQFYFYFYDSAEKQSSPALAYLVSKGWVLSDTGFLDQGNHYPRPGYLFEVKRGKQGE